MPKFYKPYGGSGRPRCKKCHRAMLERSCWFLKPGVAICFSCFEKYVENDVMACPDLTWLGNTRGRPKKCDKGSNGVGE